MKFPRLENAIMVLLDNNSLMSRLLPTVFTLIFYQAVLRRQQFNQAAMASVAYIDRS
jgi:hypothetical protein